MSYSPAANEYAVSGSVNAGFPSTQIAYVRCSADLQPGVNAHLVTTFLDVNGNLIPGAAVQHGVYDISGLTSFNTTLKSLIGSALTGKGITIV